MKRSLAPWEPPDPYSYSWLLGFHLGDGCVARAGRAQMLPIVLHPWQRELVDQHPRPFLRGLLFSDGCRTINRFKTTLPSGRVAEYAYPRYFFSNQSADIRGLFCEYCEKLGIRWTQSKARNISVSHRESVATLDAFVGPKR